MRHFSTHPSDLNFADAGRFREWHFFTFTKRIEYERRFKIGQSLACVIQSFPHWPIEIKVHNMRTTYDARRTKRAWKERKTHANEWRFLKSPQKHLKETNALGFSTHNVRTTNRKCSDLFSAFEQRERTCLVLFFFIKFWCRSACAQCSSYGFLLVFFVVRFKMAGEKNPFHRNVPLSLSLYHFHRRISFAEN